MSELVVKNGITTIAEPGFPSADFDSEYQLLKTEMDTQPPYSVYLIPNGTQLYRMKGGNEQAIAFMETLSEQYNTPNIRFLPGQAKIFADGAIYSQLMQMKDGYTDGHHGEWMTPPDLLKEQLSFYWDRGYKIHVHANGDLGIQQVLDFNLQDQQRNPRADHRFTLHHLGYFDDEQAQQMADQGIDVFTAMQAITISAARALNLESEVGSIEAGKAAKLVLLAENPFKIDPSRLRDIEVVGTVYQGGTNALSQ